MDPSVQHSTPPCLAACLPLTWHPALPPAWPLTLCPAPPPVHPHAVTLGNIFAGAVCVATLYSLAYGKLGKRVQRALDLAELLRMRRACLRDAR